MTMEMWLVAFTIGAGTLGFLLTFYLFTSNRNEVEANSILALVVFSLSVDMFTAFFPGLKGSIQANPTILLYGPLLYLYVVSLCGASSPVAREFTYAVISLYAIPIVLYLLGVIRHFSESAAVGGFPLQTKHDFLGVDIFRLTPVAMIVVVLSTATFLLLASRELRRYCQKAQEYSCNGRILNIARTRFLLYLAAFSLVLLLALYLMAGSRILAVETAYQILRLSMALSIYALAYVALKKPNWLLFAYATSDADTALDQQAGMHQLPGSKEGFSVIRDSVLREKLLEVMDTQKPYLDADMSLHLLAGKLGVHPRMLSRLINSELGCSFFDFVNKYRIAEVKARLADRASVNKTIMIIAYECGFNTKSSFNAIFRKLEGMTPTDFRNASLAKREEPTEQQAAQE